VRVTCADGWILLFGDLEVSVYEFKALQAVAPEQQGAGLFKLATGMIRLEAVEGVANTAIARRPDINPQYLKEIAALDTQNRNEQQTLAIELSARERTRLAQLS